MKTYIRKNIKGYYIEFSEEIDNQYWNGKIGTNYQDFLDNKWILLSDEQVNFHIEYPFASIEEVLNMLLSEDSIHEGTLEELKLNKIKLIEEYDLSDAVNSFDVIKDGNVIVSTWFTPILRSNYKSSIDAAELLNIENLTIPIDGLLEPITLSVQTAKIMLALIQLYADLCFIVTRQHKADVDFIADIDTLDKYDYTIGYPNKLSFVI